MNDAFGALLRLESLPALGLVLTLGACSTHDRPVTLSSDPLEQREQILETLDALDDGDEIHVMLRDGTSFRARYRGHGETELLVSPVRPSWRTLLTLGLGDRERVHELSEVEYVARSRLTRTTKALYLTVFVLGVATVASYAFDAPDDP